MVWGILGALQEEVALIHEKMNVESEDNILGTTFYKGTVFNKKIVLVCCGVGKVNAAVCTTTIIQKFGADCVINIGVAGAMGQGLKVLDVIVSTEVGFHDQDPIMLDYYPKREFFPASSVLLANCIKACEELNQPITRGRIMSGDVFVSEKAVKNSINERYAPVCVEMEGASVGHVSSMHDKPFLVIRSMSDSADDSAPETYDNFLDRAALQSANIILKMLEL